MGGWRACSGVWLDRTARTYADQAWGDDGEMVLHLGAIPRQGIGDQPCLCQISQARESDQNYTGSNPALPEDQLAEILVGGQEEDSSGRRASQYGFVGNSGVELRDVKHLPAILPEGLYDLPLDSLVGDEPHATLRGYTISARRAWAAKLMAARIA